MIHTWNWLISHWANWAFSGAFGFVGGVLGGTFKWFYPSRKEWKEERSEKAGKKLDARVLELLTDPAVRRSSQGTTGAGMPLNRASDIADHLELEHDEVHESLTRLHTDK